MRSEDGFLRWFAERHVDDESCNEAAQVEARVEAIGEGGQVAPSVLALVQRMEGPGQGGLQIAQHRVDPLELGKISRLEGADRGGHVHAAGVGHRSKAAQAIAGHQRARRQVGLGPVANRVQGEPTDAKAQVTHSLAHGVSLLRQVSNQENEFNPSHQPQHATS